MYISMTLYLSIYILQPGVRGFWVQLLMGQGARAHVLVLRECIWKASVVSLVLPAFDNMGSLGFPPRWVVYPPGFTLGNCLPFPCGEQGG